LDSKDIEVNDTVDWLYLQLKQLD